MFPGRRWCLVARYWCRSAGFASIQFNAVVETNAPAVHLWQSLGFQIIGTVPESFDHPEHGLVGLYLMYRPPCDAGARTPRAARDRERRRHGLDGYRRARRGCTA